MKSLKLKIKKQYIPFSKVIWKDRKLHEFQVDFLRDNLDSLNILSAPTGAGKTDAFGLLLADQEQLSLLEKSKDLLIIAPTRILCDQIQKGIHEMYDEKIKVDVLNSDRLNSLGNKGIKRWRDILQINRSSQVIVATPDLINYIITSGYQKGDLTKNTESFLEFTKFFTHIIIDEFHLYDYEQVANILVWQQLYNLFQDAKKKAKLIFVSATPTKFLEDFFSHNNYKFKHIQVEISLNPQNSRAIHGELNVEIIPQADISKKYISEILEDEKLIDKWNVQSEKLLCIYNSLRMLHEDYVKLEPKNQNLKIERISGYDQEYKQDPGLIEKSNLILATSALEQGVNIKVKNAIIYAGFSPQSLIQRFGRISRGDYEGRIIILMNQDKFNKIEFPEKDIPINEFYEKIYEIYENSDLRVNLMSRKILSFMGAFWYSVIKNQKNFELNRKLKELILSSEIKYMVSTYKHFCSIKFSIDKIQDRSNYIVKQDLDRFWENFVSTFSYFRSKSTESVRVYDIDLEKYADYAYDWVIRNKEIIRKDEHGNLHVKTKIEDNPVKLSYQVITLPYNESGEPPLLKKYEFERNPVNTFEKYVEEYMFHNGIKERQKRNTDDLVKIFDKILGLAYIISPKRFTVNKVFIEEDISNNIL